MKTNPEALKKFYVAIGGNEEDVMDISLMPDMIEALANVYEVGCDIALNDMTFGFVVPIGSFD